MGTLGQSFFKEAQLLPLGITDSLLQMTGGFLLIIGLYLVCKPIIRWMVQLKWNVLLTFGVVVAYSVIGLMLFEAIRSTRNGESFQFFNIATGIQGVIVFGIFLFISHLFHQLFVYIRNNKRSRSI